jgi:hypothetical protein
MMLNITREKVNLTKIVVNAEESNEAILVDCNLNSLYIIVL